MLSMLRAHGLDAGPTQRPLLTGFLTSLPADVPAIATLHAFGTLGALADAANISAASAALAVVACMALGGLLYGSLFRRAANDQRGGWLFGLAFGFLLWMLGPIPLLQWLPVRPVLSGYPAMGLLLGQLIWGLTLGVAFPLVHRRLLGGLEDEPPQRSQSTGPQAAADPHLKRKAPEVEQ
jgi:hypothetical protein